MTHKLAFTGDCDEVEFRARCAEHDYWYHSFYFDNGYEQRGDYDIGQDVADYRFPTDMNGITVLDVGTGSGWFATYFEQQGAAVTTVDVRGYSDFDVLGRPGYGKIEEEKPAGPELVLPGGRTVYYSPVSKGFWIMRDILGLQAEGLNARVYDLTPDLFGGRRFDLVFIGSLLMHLRDPIGALMAARTVCAQRLLATSFLLDGIDQPLQLFTNGDSVSWWTPTEQCVQAWLKAAGYEQCDTSGRVRLSTDRPFADEEGHTFAADQTHVLIDATIES